MRKGKLSKVFLDFKFHENEIKRNILELKETLLFFVPRFMRKQNKGENF